MPIGPTLVPMGSITEQHYFGSAGSLYRARNSASSLYLEVAEIQIHTRMCYSNFNGIIQSIIDMDADVITFENSQSDEKLLSVFRDGFKYGAGISPAVYDIHSLRIPSTDEIADRINKMLVVLDWSVQLSLFVPSLLPNEVIRFFQQFCRIFFLF